MANILIIDDDSNYASMVQQRLERAGHLVTLHIGPFGATKAASQGGIDLVLLDVFMPGLSGPQLLEVMRQNQVMSKAKVIFCSSMDPGPLKTLAEEHRADGYVPKSAERKELLAVVAHVLEGNQP
jgi:two-component system response regulator RegX3